MRKIYFGGSYIILTSKEEDSFSGLNLPTYAAHTLSELAEIVAVFNPLSPQQSICVFLSEIGVEQAYSFILADFREVKAAGGFVLNPKGEVLMIFRNGYWDLPKGKCEAEESIELAAIREVEEECGISGLSIHSLLLTTYHTYVESGIKIVKPTYWFSMLHNGLSGKLVPQLEEGISKAEWVAVDRIAPYLQQTYPSILDVFQAARFPDE